MNNHKGLTLIETLVALSILIIAVLAIVQLFPLGLKASHQAGNLTLATNLSQAKIEELIGSSYTSLAVGTTTESTLSAIHSDFSNYSRTTVIYFLDSDLNISQEDYGLKKVEVFVNWLNPITGNFSTTSLSTLITNL